MTSVPHETMVASSNGDATKKVASQGSIDRSLTDNEAEVLRLLTIEHLTPRQVEIRRQTSHQAVYKTIKSLRKKGLLNHYNLPHETMVAQSLPTMQPCNQKGPVLRLHGQEFHINILFKDQRYANLLKRSNLLNVDGNTVRLYNDAVEVYSGRSFFGEDLNSITAESMSYFWRLFCRLEVDLKLVLLKPRTQNIRQVNAHYAEVGSDLAKDCQDKGEKVRVYTRDDGKLWFLIDNSFNLHEAETVHPTTSKADMGRVQQAFNDIRDGAPLNSELLSIVKELAFYQKETSAGLAAITTYMKSQLPRDEPAVETKFERPDYLG